MEAAASRSGLWFIWREKGYCNICETLKRLGETWARLGQGCKYDCRTNCTQLLQLSKRVCRKLGSMRYTSVPCQQVGSPFLPLVVESNFLQKSQLCAFASTLVSKVIHQRLLSPKKGLSFRKALGKLGVIPTSGHGIPPLVVESNFFPKAKCRRLTRR